MKISLSICVLVLCSIAAQAQQATQAEPPKKTFEKVAYNFTVSSAEWDVTVTENVREYNNKAVKIPMLLRRMTVLYNVASTDRREDQQAALLLGCPVEDAFKIDGVVYVGFGHSQSLEMEYLQVGFYVEARLVAVKDIENATDPYNAKATRIYNRAWALHQNEKKAANK